jgi:hypothetical protein
MGINMPFLAAPGTQIMTSSKAQKLRGKQTERVSDMHTQHEQTITAEVIQFDEVNEPNTERIMKEEEVKNGRILEEGESEGHEGTEQKCVSNSSMIQEGIDGFNTQQPSPIKPSAASE